MNAIRKLLITVVGVLSIYLVKYTPEYTQVQISEALTILIDVSIGALTFYGVWRVPNEKSVK